MDTATEKQVEVPVTLTSADGAEVRRMYFEMLRIRRFEEVANRAYTSRKISGFLHLYIGQEAIAVGTASAMQKGDRIVGTYRDHGYALALGSDPNACMAEMLGKSTGLVGGVGGSMHFFDRKNGVWGGYAIIGNHCPVATGHAFAAKYNQTKEVTLCFLGDGAVGIGPTHEAMTLAALWKLPVIFVVENNRYSMGTPLSRTVPTEDISARAAGYGMASDRFEVTDPVQMRERMQVAIDRARNESLPTLIEVLCYRLRGHSMSDPAKYRAAGELDYYKQRDPLEVTRRALVEHFGVSEAEIEAEDDRISEEMAKTLVFAEASPEPEPAHRFRNIYIESEN